jgi:hypothetical protein
MYPKCEHGRPLPEVCEKCEHAMNSIDDGGPAFGVPGMEFKNMNGKSAVIAPQAGMTLRDYFAAKAMQSLIQLAECSSAEEEAKEAHRIADAMLAARNRRP